MMSCSAPNHCLKFSMKKMMPIEPIIMAIDFTSSGFTGKPISLPCSEIRYFFCNAINPTSPSNMPKHAAKKPHFASPKELHTSGEKNAPKLIPM